MEGDQSRMVSFRDLRAWQEAHRLTVMIYEATDKFPSKDGFGLTSQLQRSALSVSSNIAEGFGRQTAKDKLHFYVMARGSLVELQNQILVALDTGRLTKTVYERLLERTIMVHRLLNGLIKSTRNRA